MTQNNEYCRGEPEAIDVFDLADIKNREKWENNQEIIIVERDCNS